MPNSAEQLGPLKEVITGREIMQYFNQPATLGLIHKQAELVWLSADEAEAGFVKLISPQGNVTVMIMTDVRSHSASLNDEDEKLYQVRITEGDVPLIDFHLHPNMTDSKVDNFPSGTDIYSCNIGYVVYQEARADRGDVNPRGVGSPTMFIGTVTKRVSEESPLIDSRRNEFTEGVYDEGSAFDLDDADIEQLLTSLHLAELARIVTANPDLKGNVDFEDKLFDRCSEMIDNMSPAERMRLYLQYFPMQKVNKGFFSFDIDIVAIQQLPETSPTEAVAQLIKQALDTASSIEECLAILAEQGYNASHFTLNTYKGVPQEEHDKLNSFAIQR